ncbi:MAG TPA: hypothetical protein VJ757_09575 [Pseudonocardiaceae bacterium]|nr:hypothetical protein [Pseudonocardiaceae bacterium]
MHYATDRVDQPTVCRGPPALVTSYQRSCPAAARLEENTVKCGANLDPGG